MFFDCEHAGGLLFTGSAVASGVTYEIEFEFANAWDGSGNRLIEYAIVTQTSTGDKAIIRRNGSNPNYDQFDCCMKIETFQTFSYIQSHRPVYYVDVTVSSGDACGSTCDISGRIGSNNANSSGGSSDDFGGYVYASELESSAECTFGPEGGETTVTANVTIYKSYGTTGTTKNCTWRSVIYRVSDQPCDGNNNCGCGYPNFCSVDADSGWDSNGGGIRRVTVSMGGGNGMATLEESSPMAGDFAVISYSGGCDLSGSTVSVSAPYL